MVSPLGRLAPEFSFSRCHERPRICHVVVVGIYPLRLELAPAEAVNGI